VGFNSQCSVRVKRKVLRWYGTLLPSKIAAPAGARPSDNARSGGDPSLEFGARRCATDPERPFPVIAQRYMRINHQQYSPSAREPALHFGVDPF